MARQYESIPKKRGSGKIKHNNFVDDYTDKDTGQKKPMFASADHTLNISESEKDSSMKPPTHKQGSRGGTITTDRPTIVSFRDKVEIAASK